MASTTAIILTHQEDWEQWLADVQAVADDDIWPYINPEEAEERNLLDLSVRPEPANVSS